MITTYPMDSIVQVDTKLPAITKSPALRVGASCTCRNMVSIYKRVVELIKEFKYTKSRRNSIHIINISTSLMLTPAFLVSPAAMLVLCLK